METLPKQTSLFTEDTLTSSQGDSHANPTQWPESEKAKRMRDTSGRRCLEQYGRLNRHGSWAKTFSALLIGMEGWYSTRCRLTWRLKGTKYNRMFFQLVPSTLHTDGTGFGLLLTPSTVDITPDEERRKKRTEYRASVGRHWTPGSLTEQVFHQLLPTPRAQEPGRTSEGYGACITDVAKGYKMQGLLPTPATRDWKGARSTEALEESGRNETNSLPDAFAQTGKTSQLSPLFVEEMMGYPITWLVSPFQSGETKA